jgi:hypothetical protein
MICLFWGGSTHWYRIFSVFPFPGKTSLAARATSLLIMIFDMLMIEFAALSLSMELHAIA